MTDINKMRTKGTELEEFDMKNFLNDADSAGWLIGKTVISSIKNNYIPDRSERRLKRNCIYLKELIKMHYPKLSTQISYVQKMQRFFIDIYPENRKQIIKKILRMKTEEYKTIAVRDAKTRNEKLKNIQTITPQAIEKFADDLAEDGSLEARILLLCLSSGRRKIEILKVADRPDFKDGKLIFTKLAKRDGAGIYKVPLFFIGYQEFLNNFDYVRAHVDGKKSNEDLTLKHSTGLNKTIFKHLGIRSNSHLMRKLYSTWAMQFKPDKVHSSIYLKNILSHDEVNNDSQLNYSVIKLGDKTELRSGSQARIEKTKQRLREAKADLESKGKPFSKKTIVNYGISPSTFYKYRNEI